MTIGSTVRFNSNLQPDPDVEITARDLLGAEENMPAISTGAIDPDGILAAVGRRAIEGHLAALVAVGRINGPCRLVPAALEVVGDLGGRQGREDAGGEGQEGGLADHGCGVWCVSEREEAKVVSVDMDQLPAKKAGVKA